MRRLIILLIETIQNSYSAKVKCDKRNGQLYWQWLGLFVAMFQYAAPVDGIISNDIDI